MTKKFKPPPTDHIPRLNQGIRVKQKYDHRYPPMQQAFARKQTRSDRDLAIVWLGILVALIFYFAS